MDWIATCFIFMNIVILQARYGRDIYKLIELIKRRNSLYHKGPMLGVPRYPDELPEAEAILPGHTLIRPSQDMLKSAVKFPLRDLGGTLVYGNLDNLGITYGNTNERVLYTDFRKGNNIMSTLAEVVQASKKADIRRPLVIIMSTRKEKKSPEETLNEMVLNPEHSEDINDAREITDGISEPNSEENSHENDFRRKKSRSKFRKRSYEKTKLSSESTSSSGSSEYERNPGNPYTITKNKYYQNWEWNHAMDGDHMNINPYAPQFPGQGPSGADLFFGKKWWYFNQDDYKPMR